MVSASRAHETELRARRISAASLRDSPSKMGEATGLDGMTHGASHANRIVRFGHSGIEKTARRAELHGDHSIGSGADSGIDNDRHTGPPTDQLEISGVGDPHTRPDQGAHRHHRRAADISKPLTYDGVVITIGQDDEPIIDEMATSGQQFGHVRVERFPVTDDFDLYPVRIEGFTGRDRRS